MQTKKGLLNCNFFDKKEHNINLLFSVVLFSGWLYCGSSVSTLFFTGLIFLDAV